MDQHLEQRDAGGAGVYTLYHTLGLRRSDGQVYYAASRRGCWWICRSYSTGVR
jgi:hypothetical protein